MHRDIASPGPVVAAVRRAVSGAVARAPQGRHRLRCRAALPAPHGQPIAQAPAGDRYWRAAKGVGRWQPITCRSRPLHAERRAPRGDGPYPSPASSVPGSEEKHRARCAGGPELRFTAQGGRDGALGRTPGTPPSVDGQAVPEVGGVTCKRFRRLAALEVQVRGGYPSSSRRRAPGRPRPPQLS